MQTLPTTGPKKLVRTADMHRPAWRSLAKVLDSFTHAANALQTSYSRLQGEVAKLRFQLEQTNRELSKSLEDNQRMRTFLGRVLESLPCGVLVFDEQRQLRIANPAACRLLRGKLSGSDSRALPPDLLPLLLATLPQEGSAGEREWKVEGEEGEKIVGVTHAQLREGVTAAEETILILRDMTEERRLEREREAFRRAQALAEMAAVLAHKIRNPLGSLELFAGLLADATEQQPEIRQWVDHLQAGLRALSATVNNVLHYHNQTPAELLRLDLVRLLNETVNFLRPMARQLGLGLQLICPNHELLIQADSHRLQQAFLNLALNAFRAMSPGGLLNVHVRAERNGELPAAVIEFTDQGVGIAPEHLEKIFEAGFTTRPGSPGLGLAVTKKVVEEHRGTIMVRSEVGRGTTFTLVFPAQGGEG